jgi:hypothetical protein
MAVGLEIRCSIQLSYGSEQAQFTLANLGLLPLLADTQPLVGAVILASRPSFGAHRAYRHVAFPISVEVAVQLVVQEKIRTKICRR